MYNHVELINMKDTQKYLVLDTNILVGYLETGFLITTQDGKFKETQDLKILGDLLKSLDQDKIKFLLTEITLLELERIKPEKDDELKSMYEEAAQNMVDFISKKNKKIATSAIDKIRKNLNTLYLAEHARNTDAWKLLTKIIYHKNTILLALNERVLLSSYKRGIAGHKPYVMHHFTNRDSAPDKNNIPFHEIQPDCTHVEAVKEFLEGKKNFELYFGSDDSDFYTSLDKSELDPKIKQELKVKVYSTNLLELLKEAIGLKTITNKIEAKARIKAKTIESNAYPSVGKAQIEIGGAVGDADTGVVKGDDTTLK
jgi:hypothetical protein